MVTRKFEVLIHRARELVQKDVGELGLKFTIKSTTTVNQNSDS